jgi:hypothetical protein
MHLRRTPAPDRDQGRRQAALMGAFVSQQFPLRVVSCRVAGLARIWPGASLGLPDHTVLQRDSIYRVQQGEGVHDGADAGVPGVRRRTRGLERALRQAQAQRRSRPVRRFRASCTRDIPVPRGSVARVPVGSLQEIFAPLWAVSAHSFPEMPSGARERLSLPAPDDAVTGIALECGFSDLSHSPPGIVRGTRAAIEDVSSGDTPPVTRPAGTCRVAPAA